jgi:dTDP-glucose 4,6-dehydratase
VYVEDHNNAVWAIMRGGAAGEKYNIGGENEWENIRLLYTLIAIVSRKTGLDEDKVRGLIVCVKDRPGHDRRYAIDCFRIRRELGWTPRVSFEEGLERTVDWYLENAAWTDSVRSGEYQNWVQRNYEDRG